MNNSYTDTSQTLQVEKKISWKFCGCQITRVEVEARRSTS